MTEPKLFSRIFSLGLITAAFAGAFGLLVSSGGSLFAG
jgi:hypothetical protein